MGRPPPGGPKGKGDAEERLAALCQEHVPWLQRFLLSHGARPDDVHDLVQEALAVLWQRRRDVPEAKARAFLGSTARHILLAHNRQRQTRQALTHTYRQTIVEALFPASTPGGSATGHLAQQERLERLSDLIHTLPPRMQQVVRLVHLERQTHAETAHRLNIASKTVYKSERQGLQRLRHLLTEQDAPSEQKTAPATATGSEKAGDAGNT
jgi:RNA polymerase sigma factor (sigma-70 family)